MENNKNPALMCRLCSSSDTVTNALLDLASDEISFAAEYRKIIYIVTGINIQVMDSVPSRVCRNCIKKALENYNYRKTAQHNNLEYMKEQMINKAIKPEDDSDNEVEFVSISVDMTRTTSIPADTLMAPLKLRIDLKNLVCHNVKDTRVDPIVLPQSVKPSVPTDSETPKCHKSIKAIKTQYPTIALPTAIHGLNFDPIVLLDNSKVENYVSTLVRKQRRRKYTTQTKDDIKFPKRMDVPDSVPKSERESKDLLLSSLGLLPISETRSSSSSTETTDICEQSASNIECRASVDTECTTSTLEDSNNKLDKLDSSLLEVVESYKVFICKVCNKIFRSLAGLKKHKLKFHNKCKVCFKKLSTLEETKLHKCNLFKKPKELQISLGRMELDNTIRHKWSKPFSHLLELIECKKHQKLVQLNQNYMNKKCLSSASLTIEEHESDNLIEAESLTIPNSPLSFAGSEFELHFSDEELDNFGDGDIKSALTATSGRDQRQFLNEAVFLKSSFKTPPCFKQTVACSDMGTQADSIDLIFSNSHHGMDSEVVIENLGSYFTIYNKVPIELDKYCDKLKVTCSKIDLQKRSNLCDIINQEPISLHVSKSKQIPKLKINLTNIIRKKRRFELNKNVKNAVNEYKNAKFQQGIHQAKSCILESMLKHGNNSSYGGDKAVKDMEVVKLVSNTPTNVNISQHASSSSIDKSVMEYVSDSSQSKVAQTITSTVINLDSENEKENTRLDAPVINKALDTNTQESESRNSSKSPSLSKTANSIVQNNIPILKIPDEGAKEMQKEPRLSLYTTKDTQFEQLCSNRINNPNMNSKSLVLNHNNTLPMKKRYCESLVSFSSANYSQTKTLPPKSANQPDHRLIHPKTVDNNTLVVADHQLINGKTLNKMNALQHMPSQTLPGKHRNLPHIIERPQNHAQINQPDVISNTIPVNLLIHQNLNVLQNQTCYINQHYGPDQTVYNNQGWIYEHGPPPLHYIYPINNSTPTPQLINTASEPLYKHVQFSSQQYQGNSMAPPQDMQVKQVEHTPSNFPTNLQTHSPCVSNVVPAIRIMKPWEINNKSFT